MRSDRNKLIAKARTHASKGQLRRAIELYREVVAREPSDAHTWLKIAELCKRTEADGPAADAYAEVARCFRVRGFAQKAAAAYEQVVRLRPADAGVHLEVAEIYCESSRLADAQRHLEAAADAYQEAERTSELIGVLARLIEITPADIKVRYRLARAYAAEGMSGHAVEHFMELATLYLRYGDATRALHVLRFCFEAQPENTDLLATMARAFEVAQLPDKVAAVLAERDRLLGVSRPEATPRNLAHGTSRRPPTDSEDVQLRKLFTEATSYIKVGLIDRAVPLLRAIVQAQPSHEEARRALGLLTGDRN